MARIFVYGEHYQGYLEMDTGTTLEMETYSDIFEEALEAGEFSLPVEFPWTDNNRRLLNFAERIHNVQVKKNFWVCDVYDSTGMPYMLQAKLTLLEKAGDFGYTRGKFVASISGNKGLFGSKIKNKNLRDLTLGGPITWQTIDSRKFAENHMKGLTPQYPYLSFAPVVIENFFDQSKNYNNEFLARDTVNDIVSTGSGANDWVFGRPKSTNPNEAAVEGTPEYINYRTIPFFSFKYVLEKVYEEMGYVLTGDVVNNTDFADLYLFNTTALEYYSAAVNVDYNRRIDPKQHVPDMPVFEFLTAVFKFFCVYPVFAGNNQVELKYRKKIFSNRKILNITPYTSSGFNSVFSESTEAQGYALKYDWDGAESYHSDRIKDLASKNIIGVVDTAAALATFTYTRPLTTDDAVYVTSENMYYAVANATGPTTLWDAWCEGLHDYEEGDGSRDATTGMGTLATYVELDDALYVRRNKLAARMAGSYWNDKFVRVENKFGLSVFYITPQNIDGNVVPVSHNHNTDAAGNQLATYSLALKATHGIGNILHRQWQQLLNKVETVEVEINTDEKLLREIQNADILQAHNIMFIPYKRTWSVPLRGKILQEMKPL
ncbi:MAG TPA: hypothetical protein PKY29_04350 [Ferruginibacter sp.]|nr:hypothetical protein [Ferruginibacter sp.]HRQ20519.1 hypothetical protein [Ferruginibacter sp.]